MTAKMAEKIGLNMRITNVNKIWTGFIVISRYCVVFIMVLLLTSFTGLDSAEKKNIRIVKQRKFSGLIDAVYMYYGILDHAEIVQHMADVESSRRADVVSSKGAIGVMQVTAPVVSDYNRAHSTDISVDAPYNPITNIIIGVWFFRQCVTRCRDMDKALSAYNAGHNSSRFMLSYVAKFEGVK